MNKTLLGIMCSDYNIPYLENCLYSIEKVIGDDVDITVFGFNGRPEYGLSHKRTEVHCAQRNIPYIFIGSQDYVPIDNKYRTGDGREGLNYRFGMLLMMRFCEIFYKKGYEEVYILHPDTIILKDFRPLFNEHKKDKWSIIMPFVSIQKICRGGPSTLTFEDACKLNSYQIADTDVRLTGSVLLHSKEFIKAIYKHYGTEERMFNKLFLDTKYCGDCGWFDMIECMGFTIRPIFKDVLSEIPNWPKGDAKWPSHLYWLHGEVVRNLVTTLGFPVGYKNISLALRSYL